MNRKICLLTAAILAVTTVASFGGCKKKEEVKSAADIEYNKENIYPIKCDDELSCWMELNTVLSTSVSNFGDSELGKELEKQTGIKVKYIHPALGSTADQFSLMLASQDLPDIIQASWSTFGAQKAIDSKYIIGLNDVISKWAPNLNEKINADPLMAKAIKTDEGNLYSFPFWREDKSLCTFMGPIIRKDWLDKLGLEVPETIDEWEIVLTAFKNELGVKCPLSFNSMFFGYGFLTGAYDTTQNFFVADNGKVKYGPLEPGFKDFLMLMNKWYKAGLIDKNIVDTPDSDTLMLNDKAGATFGFVGGGLGSMLENKVKSDPSFNLVAAPYPVLKKGEKCKFGQMDSQYGPTSFAISGKCKNVELAARFLDFGYGEKGGLIYNFGTEGTSYTMDNGNPTYTDLILHNENGDTIDSMIAKYCMAGSSGPFIHDKRAVDQTRPFEQQREAIKIWSNTLGDKTNIPAITLTADEADRFGNMLSEINTYVSTEMFSYITGTKSFDEFDSFSKQLKNFGIDEVLKIENDAVARYNER